MKAIATYFGKEVLRDVDEKDFLQRPGTPQRSIWETRCRCFGLCISSVIMRELQHRLHPFAKEDLKDFLNMIKASGDSSFKYLQNVYTNRDVQNQAVSIALAVSEMYSETMEYAVCMEADLPEPFRHL